MHFILSTLTVLITNVHYKMNPHVHVPVSCHLHWLVCHGKPVKLHSSKLSPSDSPFEICNRKQNINSSYQLYIYPERNNGWSPHTQNRKVLGAHWINAQYMFVDVGHSHTCHPKRLLFTDVLVGHSPPLSRLCYIAFLHSTF